MSCGRHLLGKVSNEERTQAKRERPIAYRRRSMTYMTLLGNSMPVAGGPEQGADHACGDTQPHGERTAMKIGPRLIADAM
jgi:hypothetical protein